MANNNNTTTSVFTKVKRFVFRSAIGLTSIGVLLGMSFPDKIAKTLLPERIIVKEIPEKESSFDELVSEIPEAYGIPNEIVQTILVKESGGRMSAKRFEPAHLERFGKKISSDPETAREYASSHCAFQIMGWHLKFNAKGEREDRGEWYDLYNPETCVREFARIWIQCESRWKDLPDKVQRYRKAFECYNGSEKYARDAMNKLAYMAIQRL